MKKISSKRVLPDKQIELYKECRVGCFLDEAKKNELPEFQFIIPFWFKIFRWFQIW